jgi:formylmethanofuran--tetrahydromethanopterin N-formyltransferase
MESMKSEANEAILPFPSGICHYGSKAGSLTYKLKASTNHSFCPKLRTLVPGSQVSEDVNCVYEIVVNSLTVEAIKKAMGKDAKVAASVAGVVRISAGNHCGKLGPHKVFLKEILELT